MSGGRLSVALLVAAILTAAAAAPAADVETITHGREVELADHLVPGKFVLFDFYADWCGPCRALEPTLLELAGRHRERLALRKVDIINWESAVARQYAVGSIPYLVLFGPDGNRLAAGDAMTVINRLAAELGDDGRPPGDSGRGGSLVPLLVVATIFAVTVGLVARRRRAPVDGGPSRRVADRPASVDTAATPGDPAIWFALLQGSLEGPFTRVQLDELVGRGALDRLARVRRRGDAEWSTVDDVLD